MAEELIGQYRLESQIGAGGMGHVYRAVDINLDRRVALKILADAQSEDANLRARFLQEARTASALTHPHVCVIYEVGESADSRPFIAMELINGKSLSELIGTEPLAVPQILTIAVQVADALEAAHALQIIHRDIKSANIMVDHRGQAKVLDFGLAKRAESDFGLGETQQLNLTQEGQLLGTPNYMSPEQALGQPADHRSDLFSLGVVLFEMATAQLPFQAETLGKTLNAIVHSAPRSLTRLNYDIPEELERIILKCLEKDSSTRFQTAKELRIDLEALQRKILLADSGRSHSVDLASDSARGNQLASTTEPEDVPADQIRESDILISCAAIDDQPLVPQTEGWVEKLKRNLKVKVEQLTGEPVRVESAPMPPGDISLDETLLSSIATAKTLISVVSPALAKAKSCHEGVSHYCQRIAESPIGEAGIPSKLFRVVKAPVADDELPESITQAFRQLLGIDFFEVDHATGRIREFDDFYGEDAAQRFYERVYDLAYEICRGLNQQQQLEESAVTGQLTEQSHKTVYLAETTTDLRESRDRLRRELQEQGHRVVPEQTLPLVGSELESAVQGYLAQCDCAVHFVGERYGMVPEDSVDSIVAIQNRVAAEFCSQHELNRIIWMPRHLTPHDERQATYVNALLADAEMQRGADVICDSLENLKQLLFERWQREEQQKASQPDKPQSLDTDEIARLYLVHEQSDEEAVEAIEDLLYESGIEVILPEWEGNESDISRIHIQNLTDCDAVLVYYGTTAKSWVDIKLRELTKAIGYRDGRQIASRSVYIAPPMDRRKERFRTLSAEIIRQEGDTIAADALRALAQQIKDEKRTSSG